MSTSSVCGIFAAVSGSSGRDPARPSVRSSLPELDKRGYDKGSEPRFARRPPATPRAADPAIDPDGGLCGDGERLGVAGVSSAASCRAALVMALYSGYIVIWSLLNPDKVAAARPADVVPAQGAGIRKACSVHAALNPRGVLLARASVLQPQPSGAAWGGRRRAGCSPGGAARSTARRFFESVMSATRAHLHDHADPGGCRLHHPRRWPIRESPAALGGVGCKGRNLTPGMLALYLSIMYIILGCLIDGHLDDRAHRRHRCLPMVKGRGPRSSCGFGVLSGDPCRDGADHAAGRPSTCLCCRT